MLWVGFTRSWCRERQQERTALPSVCPGYDIKRPSYGYTAFQSRRFCGVLAWSSHPRHFYLSVLRCGPAPSAVRPASSESPTTEERCTIKVHDPNEDTRIRGYETNIIQRYATASAPCRGLGRARVAMSGGARRRHAERVDHGRSLDGAGRETEGGAPSGEQHPHQTHAIRLRDPNRRTAGCPVPYHIRVCYHAEFALGTDATSPW